MSEFEKEDDNFPIWLVIGAIIIGLAFGFYSGIAGADQQTATAVTLKENELLPQIWEAQNKNLELKEEFIGLLKDLNSKFYETAFQGMACKERVRCLDANAIQCDYDLEAMEADCFGDNRITDKQNDFMALIQRAVNKYGG